MGKALGVVGSPRRGGNTHLLVTEVLEGAEAGIATADSMEGTMSDVTAGTPADAAITRGAAAETHTGILLLGDMTIRECNGCHVCWRGEPCPLNDDMNGVYPRIEESDFLVFGTPVYWYGPSALMKAFIDRFVYFNCPANRKKIRGKRAAIVIPFEENDPETAFPVVDFFERCLRYLEVEFAERVLVPGVTRRGEVRARAQAMKEAFQAGRKLVRPGPGRTSFDPVP
jgi:multimeric flavodoxin WrbA